MADVQLQQQRPAAAAPPATAFLRRFQHHAPMNTSQLIGFLTLIISGGILLVLTGLTLTASILGVIFFAPLIVLSSPVWVPIGTVLFVSIAGVLSVFGFAIGALIAASWLYRYFRGFHPPGSDRVDYARTRIRDTANHVKDYAGGYLHGSKVKDAAPSA